MESNCATAVLCELAAVDWAPPQRATAIERPIQVLLVEDDPDSASLAMHNLTEDPDDPFRVVWCPTLIMGMHRLLEPGIDVILLDLGLPELTGYRSYRAIEAASGHIIPVVIFTSDDRNDIRNLTLDFGASDYLLKGDATPVELRKALREAVREGWPKRPGAMQT